MKVLEKGREQKGWSKDFECTGDGNGGGGCGAKLLVEQDDVYMTYSHARDETTGYHTFMCPECGVETDIPSSIRLPFSPRRMGETEVARRQMVRSRRG